MSPGSVIVVGMSEDRGFPDDAVGDGITDDTAAIQGWIELRYVTEDWQADAIQQKQAEQLQSLGE